jgi:hypothetical protein
MSNWSLGTCFVAGALFVGSAMLTSAGSAKALTDEASAKLYGGDMYCVDYAWPCRQACDYGYAGACVQNGEGAYGRCQEQNPAWQKCGMYAGSVCTSVKANNTVCGGVIKVASCKECTGSQTDSGWPCISVDRCVNE